MSTEDKTTAVPISMSKIANSSTTKLFDCALFRFAHSLWLAKINSDPKFRENFSNQAERILAVSEYFLEHYPETPLTIQRHIISCVRKIGRETSEYFTHYDRKGIFKSRSYVNLPFEKILWTSQFTIDRVRTSILSHTTANIEGHECPAWVKKKWALESLHTKDLLFAFFEKYSIIVYIYCETRLGHYGIAEFERYFRFICSYIDGGTSDERALKFFIINGNIECLDYFRDRITIEKYREIVLVMIEDMIAGSHSPALKPPENAFAQTVVFLWKYLYPEDRCHLVQKHFSKFYHFLLCFPGTESLISAIEWYKPLIDDTRENCRHLESTAMKITSDLCDRQRYRRMFEKLYESVGISLSTIDIVNLLEVLLAINDVEMASMMVRTMDVDRRNELLDVIPEVWTDLWSATIDKETFLAFFFEVQSYIFRSVIRIN